MPRKFRHRHLPQPTRKPRGASRATPLAFVFGLMMLAFGVGYLVQVNSASSKGYQIRSLEREVANLKEERERLELKVAQEQSVQAVEAKVRDMGMVPAPDVYYMAVVPSTVAQR